MPMYFISYTAISKDGKTHFGWLVSNAGIRNARDLIDLENDISLRTGVKDVVILNFKKFTKFKELTVKEVKDGI